MGVSEGKAEIEVVDAVFYNPKMATLRNISIALLNAIGKKTKYLLDATTATGIRGIRYAIECKVENVIMLDINEKAYRNALINVKKNKINAKVFRVGIQKFANTTAIKFDVIDLDPFGTPAPYIFDLMKVSKDGTIFMVTATDTAVLCGAHQKACIRVYGATPLHNELCHEVGLRILIGYCAKIAAQFVYGIEPLLSISDMHYMRVFFRLKKGAENAVSSVKKIGFVSVCRRCHNFSYSFGLSPKVETTCNFCNNDMSAAGPLWLGKLFEKKLIGKMLGERPLDAHAFALLNRIYNELDTPFFYSVPKITKYLRISGVPIEKVMKNIGKEASRTHFSHEGIKTNAAIEEVVNAIKKVSTSH